MTRNHLKPTTVVLGLLCVMYLITYVDRVNVATAASDIRRELSLTNTQLGLVFSAFAYPYLLFQVFGGWVGDRVGPRLTLFVCGLIWAGATIFTGLATNLTTLFLIRVVLGVGEGATFPSQPARCNSGCRRRAGALRRGSRTRLRGSAMPSRRLSWHCSSRLPPGGGRSWRWAAAVWCG